MSMERDTLMEILRDACRAPSADNTQPWRFVVESNTIRVINTGDQVESIFNYRQMVNHASLGTCLENLSISAQSHGFHVDLKLFPDPTDQLRVAEARLVPEAAAHHELAGYIEKRASNRKKYHPKEIESEKLSELVACAGSTEKVVFVSNKEEVKNLARIVSAGEKLALENKSIHDFLFQHVTWTKEEDAKKHGFLIDTFEFAPPQKALFKLFRNWAVLRFFVPFGFPDFVAKDMAKVYSTSGAFGIIVTPDNSSASYVRAGMLFERIWLTATKLGLALQPTTGLHFFAQPVLEGNTFDLSNSTVSFIKEKYSALKRACSIEEEKSVAIVFRIGYADAPSARTTRFAPNVEFED